MATGRVPTTANSPLTAKGDLFGYSTTQARVAVGNDGETLVADSSASTGLRWQGNFAAGKNKIINGDFNISQRGTSFSNPNGAYCLDRFLWSVSTAVPTYTVSQQTFTPGTAPVAGYEAQYFCRTAITSQGSSTAQYINHRVEDVRTLAGQTVTFSFWAKANTNITINDAKAVQNFGSGGSGSVSTTLSGNVQGQTVTTSWQRFTSTITLPSISGKTIGSSSYLLIYLGFDSSNGNYTFDTWGWQLEAGSVATAFQTATGTLAGELAACQRYYERVTADASYGFFGNGYAFSTSAGYVVIPFKTSKRTTPTVMDTSAASTFQFDDGTTGYTPTALAISAPLTNTSYGALQATGATGMTQYRPALFVAKNSTTAYIGFSAEL